MPAAGPLQSVAGILIFFLPKQSTMTLQTQIRLGLLFLCILLVITGGVGIYFLLDSGQNAAGMEVVLIICMILAGDFLLYFPPTVARRVKRLTEATNEIAGGQFDQRIMEEWHDEFGEIARSVNAMAAIIEAQRRQPSNKPALAALQHHIDRLDRQSSPRLSSEQMVLISQIISDCKRLLQTSAYPPQQ